MCEINELVTAYLGIGSNLGDRVANVRMAILALGAHPRIHLDPNSDIASLFETHPLGVPDPQPDFLNSAVRVSTSLSADGLLQAAMAVEQSLGRIRSRRNEARIIDVDLLLYGDHVICRPDLSVPHPRLAGRRFVLEPLSEIAAAITHPVLGFSIARMAERCRVVNAGQEVRRVAPPNWAVRYSASGVNADSATSPAT